MCELMGSNRTREGSEAFQDGSSSCELQCAQEAHGVSDCEDAQLSHVFEILSISLKGVSFSKCWQFLSIQSLKLSLKTEDEEGNSVHEPSHKGNSPDASTLSYTL